MATITLAFSFQTSNAEDSQIVEQTLKVDCSLSDEIVDFAQEWISDASDGNDDEWEFIEFEIVTFDDDCFESPIFDDIDECVEYVERCEQHGEAYRLRYADTGDNYFEDEYNGCWDSAEEFVRNIITECYEIPDHLEFYIDWEKYTRDVMMDYSEYNGVDGVHIFRD